MKIPENMTEDEVIDTILTISRKIASKFVFAFYDEEDIIQEAFIIGIEGLERYDSSRPLSNFMYTHISNRLKNFKRDNYYRLDIGSGQQIQNKKRSILDAIDINAVSSIHSHDDSLLDIQSKDILDLIDRKLPHQYRRDYLRLQQNVSLSKHRKAQIEQIIQDIITQGEDYNPNSAMHNFKTEGDE
jgi:DNA-directed RNA polymerase specialized sigma24 family protein